MTEPHTIYISPSIVFMDSEGIAINQSEPIESFWMDLDLLDDHIPDSGVPWDPPEILNTSFETEPRPLDDSHSTNMLSNQHDFTGGDDIPILETSIGLDIDSNFDFAIDMSANLARLGSLSEEQDFELPIPDDGGFNSAEVVSNHNKDTRPRLNQSQINTLNKWVAGCAAPYPTKNEKLSLAKRTGLKVSQISSWFSRLRQKRFREACPNPPQTTHTITPSPMKEMELPFLSCYEWGCRLSQLSLPITHTEHVPLGETIRRSRSLPSFFTVDHLQNRTHCPIFGWPQKGSLDVVLSSDTERSSLNNQRGFIWPTGSLGPSGASYFSPRQHSTQSYIYRWLQGLPNSVTELHFTQQDYHFPGLETPDSSRLNTSTQIECQMQYGTREPLDMQDSASIAWSARQSDSSAGSHNSLGSRKGRRIFAYPKSRNKSISIRQQSQDDEVGTDDRKKYVCTVCKSRFSRPFLLKRHEESAHAPQLKWICGPHDSSCTTDITIPPCPVCNERKLPTATNSPEVLYICPHDFSECWSNPVSERTFFRRDALLQHLNNVHKEIFQGESHFRRQPNRLNLDDWSYIVDTSSYDLRCHFCGTSNDNWDARCKHICAHFDAGTTINQWKPTYSFNHNQPANPSKPFDLFAPPGTTKITTDEMCKVEWVRNTGDGLEGWCGFCRPGRWLLIGSSRFRHDRSILHGISTKTGKSFLAPGRLKWTITHGIEGLCARCNSWVVLERTTVGEESWFRHSFECESDIISEEEKKQQVVHLRRAFNYVKRKQNLIK